MANSLQSLSPVLVYVFASKCATRTGAYCCNNIKNAIKVKILWIVSNPIHHKYFVISSLQTGLVTLSQLTSSDRPSCFIPLIATNHRSSGWGKKAWCIFLLLQRSNWVRWGFFLWSWEVRDLEKKHKKSEIIEEHWIYLLEVRSKISAWKSFLLELLRSWMMLLLALIISRFRTHEAKIPSTWMPSQRPGVPQHWLVRPFV